MLLVLIHSYHIISRHDSQFPVPSFGDETFLVQASLPKTRLEPRQRERSVRVGQPLRVVRFP